MSSTTKQISDGSDVGGAATVFPELNLADLMNTAYLAQVYDAISDLADFDDFLWECIIFCDERREKLAGIKLPRLSFRRELVKLSQTMKHFSVLTLGGPLPRNPYVLSSIETYFRTVVVKACPEIEGQIIFHNRSALLATADFDSHLALQKKMLGALGESSPPLKLDVATCQMFRESVDFAECKVKHGSAKIFYPNRFNNVNGTVLGMREPGQHDTQFKLKKFHIMAEDFVKDPEVSMLDRVVDSSLYSVAMTRAFSIIAMLAGLIDEFQTEVKDAGSIKSEKPVGRNFLGCAICRAPTTTDGKALLCCGRCRRAYYCGKAHQTQHWKAEHKAKCKAPESE